MVSQPTYLKGDKEIVVRMLDNLTLMNWSYNGKFKHFKKNNLYKIPTMVAIELSKQGYCYYVEGLKK